MTDRQRNFLAERPVLIPSAIAAVMLLGAIGYWPYGYYTVLRWVTCAAAIAAALGGYTFKIPWAIWSFGFIAILFNPLIPVHLSRDLWQLMDIAAAVLFAAAALLVRRTPQEGA